jgi:uncharacterized membrane protein YedE/YeeE
MADFLLTRPAPFVIGALLGLTVVGVLATLNRQLGALGGYSAVYERVSGRAPALGWKAWFLLGILLGSLVFRLLAGSGTVGEGYGWLTRSLTGDLRPLVGVLLVVGGAMIGYGAKQARGCTAGNGICGTALASPASFVATGTFMAVAVGATFLIDAVIA